MHSPVHNEIICAIKIRANTLLLVQPMRSFREIDSFGWKKEQKSFARSSLWSHGCRQCTWNECAFVSQHAANASRLLLIKAPALTVNSIQNCSQLAATEKWARQHGETDCQLRFWSLIQHKSHTKNIRLGSEHMCHILLSRENNRRSIKTSGKWEHERVSPVWLTAGFYLNLLMWTCVPAPPTTNQVPPLQSQIKYLFFFPSSLSR